MEIIHIDMDAFYAAVEIRDNPDLTGKPVIIGSMPGERGVVSTCDYIARKYGIHSSMPIHEAYRRCPHGVYLRPNMAKYQEASDKIHKIWDDYTDIVEYISLDEGFLDITGSAHLFGGAKAIAKEIKRRTLADIHLTCSVGIGYSMMSAKLASEEDKPDGLFHIPTPAALIDLIGTRSVRTIFGVGAKTATALEKVGITTVNHIRANAPLVSGMFGKHGPQIVDLANGIDPRKVGIAPKQQSIGTENTFQQDIADYDKIKDILRLTAKKLAFDIQTKGLYATTITLKVVYANANLKSITRSKTRPATNRSSEIYQTTIEMLAEIEKRPLRLAGITLSNFTTSLTAQLSILDMASTGEEDVKKEKLDNAMLKLQLKYGQNIVKTVGELKAQEDVYEYI